jgi:uncharacterized membrane protein YphA (DoxX/SURF4 family)
MADFCGIPVWEWGGNKKVHAICLRRDVNSLFVTRRIHACEGNGMNQGGKIGSAFWILRLGLGLSAFAAGADKFTNVLTNWEKYLSRDADQAIPMSRKNFMRLVGVIEMLVGAGILTSHTRLASYGASAWLLAISANLIARRDYDIAVRDVNMALAAFALGQLSGARREQLASRSTEPRFKKAA